MAHTLRWIPLDATVQKPVDIAFQEADGRLYFSYADGLTFGYLELDDVQITNYFLPEDTVTIHTLRPWMLITNEEGTV